MSSKWALNLFKGRIGEAVVEAVLLEFGYTVDRVGFGQGLSMDDRDLPDLLVTDQRTQKQRHVEVKYRSARPTTVQLDARRIKVYRDRFPQTVVALTSAWDGGIYCTSVQELPFPSGKPEITLSLLEPIWQPIWDFFPRVQPGVRLKRIWNELQGTLTTFGSRQAFGRQDRMLWDGEYEALTSYLEESWDEDLLQFGIDRPDAEKMTLEELWTQARQIVAASLVMELLEPTDDNQVESRLALLAFNRARDQKGENLLSIDLEGVSKSLGWTLEATKTLMAAILEQIKAPPDSDKARKAMELLDELPDGIGGAYLLDQAMSVEASEHLDLKTALKLGMSRCRLDI